jgi:hypothetical protein
MADARVTKAQRKQVTTRAYGCCEYCLSPAKYGTESLSVEHIFPRSKGGRTELNNLALACQGCNNHKFTRTEAVDPVTGETVPLYHPRHHRWREHFAWSEDYLFIRGVTPTGRATVALLQLNREGVVNLRQVLQLASEHPPQHN